MKKLLTAGVILLLICVSGVCFGADLTIERPSTQQINLLRSGLNEDITIGTGAAIKSTKHNNAYYVGLNFYAEGAGKMTGVWLMGGLKNKPSLVFSVGGFAHQFSGMRKASETKAAAYIWDKEYTTIVNYLKDRK